MQALEEIKHDVLTKSKQFTCAAVVHCDWPLPELQRPLRFFNNAPIASVDAMHRPRRARPLLAASVAKGVTALAAAEVGAASAHKKASRGAAAAAAGRNLQKEADLARGGARTCCHQRSMHGVRRRRRQRGVHSNAPMSRRDRSSTTMISLQQTQCFG